MPVLKFVGVELYFEDLPRARQFYAETIGLPIAEDQPGHHVKFGTSQGFLCLERKGAEDYPSSDKAVLFFEVPDLPATIAAIGRDCVIRSEPGWAVLRDPEGHNVLLLQAG